MIKIITLSFGAVAMGWFIYPYVFINASGDCISNTTFIYDEADKTVISKSRWEVLRGGEQAYYSSVMSVIPFKGKKRDITIERTVNANLNYHLDSFTIRTMSAFRIAGPQRSDPELGKYIDPPAKEGFNARVYAYSIGERVMLGFRNLPLSVCHK